MSSIEKKVDYNLERWPKERPGPQGGKRDLNRKKKIQTLCNSAVKLFLEFGIETVTIDEITKSAGVAKGSFYRYFKDKEELVKTVFTPLYHGFHEAFRRCEERIEQSASDEELFQCYEMLAAELSQVFFPHLQETQLYLQECRGPAVGSRKPVKELVELIHEKTLLLTESAHKTGLWRDIDPQISSLTVIGASETILFMILQGKLTVPPLSISTNLISLILDGLRKQPS